MHKRRLYFLASFWLDGAILANDLRVEVILVISEPVPSTTRKRLQGLPSLGDDDCNF